MRYLIVLLILTACGLKKDLPIIQKLETPTQSLMQAISIVDDQTVWISGHDATFIRSMDQGTTWDVFKHPTGDTLQFRDIHGFDKTKAVLMSAGPGPLSRIFTFSNDSIWEENFVMEDSLGFLDCIDFWDDMRGIAYGDAIDEYPYILLTQDGGKSWKRKDSEDMPKAGKGEGGFAASGTCVTTGSDGRAWIATGAGGNARILVTEDYGNSWNVIPSPLVKGEAAGNTSISFSGNTGFLTGGDLFQPEAYTENCAISMDGGNSWKLTNSPQTKGAFYGGAISVVGDQSFVFACGPNGLDLTTDFGNTWTQLDTLDLWAVSLKRSIGYVSGRNGEVLKISLQE